MANNKGAESKISRLSDMVPVNLDSSSVITKQWLDVLY